MLAGRHTVVANVKNNNHNHWTVGYTYGIYSLSVVLQARSTSVHTETAVVKSVLFPRVRILQIVTNSVWGFLQVELTGLQVLALALSSQRVSQVEV